MPPTVRRSQKTKIRSAASAHNMFLFLLLLHSLVEFVDVIIASVTYGSVFDNDYLRLHVFLSRLYNNSALLIVHCLIDLGLPGRRYGPTLSER